MSRWMGFIRQPPSRNCTASQSRSAGKAGWRRCAEVENGRNQGRPQVPHPDLIDRHAGRQGIAGIGDPARSASRRPVLLAA